MKVSRMWTGRESSSARDWIGTGMTFQSVLLCMLCKKNGKNENTLTNLLVPSTHSLSWTNHDIDGLDQSRVGFVFSMKSFE